MVGGFLDRCLRIAQIAGQCFVGLILRSGGNPVFGVQPGTQVNKLAALAAEGEEPIELRRFPSRSPQGAIAVWAGQLVSRLWLPGLHWPSHSGFPIDS
jgi:hypothetical protein